MGLVFLIRKSPKPLPRPVSIPRTKPKRLPAGTHYYIYYIAQQKKRRSALPARNKFAPPAKICRWGKLSVEKNLSYFFSFKRSRISVSNTSSLEGAGGGAGAAGFSSFFFLESFITKRTSRNTQNAMMIKSRVV